MNDKEASHAISSVFLLSFIFMIFHLVFTFSDYFAGFFFGLLFYSFADAYMKKDL